MNNLELPSKRRRLLTFLVELHSSPSRWVIAMVAFCVAFVFRYIMDASLPVGFPFLTFFPAVILTAFFAGFLPGALVAILSTIVSWYFFIAPYSFALNASTAIALGFFVAIATVDLLVIHFMFKWLGELDDERQRNRQLAVSRELLFQEMQHRISNNLSLVGAILRMQQKSITDDAALRALNEAADRVTLVGKIQRRLHDPKVQDVGLREFIREICLSIMDASGVGDEVQLAVLGADAQLHPDSLAPVILIVAELVSNALEHAFVGRSNNRITIDIAVDTDVTSITVHDNGAGVPEDFDITKVQSLGLKVAHQLARQQGGSLKVTTKEGARFALMLPRHL